MIGPSYNIGATGYDEFFGQVTRLYISALMQAAQLREGQAILNVATGTGITAEALVVVGLRVHHQGEHAHRGKHLLTHLPTSPRARRTGLRHTLLTVCFTVCAIAVSGMAAADPISPQCWQCLQRLALELPAVNPQEDPSYEQGLTPGSVLPALANCSLDDGEILTLQQIIKVFTDAQVAGGGAAYVREHLASLPGVSAEDRVKLVDGATKDLDTTLRHLVDHNCRLLLQSHFDEGASRKWVLQMIEIGQKSRETY